MVLPLFPVCISFVVPSTAVSVDEATVGIGCLDFTTGDRNQIMAAWESKSLKNNKNCNICCWQPLHSLPLTVIKLNILRQNKHTIQSTYQWGFKVRHNGRVPCGRHHRVNRVLLLRAVHLLYEDWWAILSLRLGVLVVCTCVHTVEAIFTKECVYGFNSGLWGEEEKRNYCW